MASQRQIDDKIKQHYLEKLRLIKQSGHVNPFETEDEKQKRIERAKKDVRFCVEYYFPHYATAPSADFHINLANRVKKNQRSKILVRWGRGLAKSVWCDIIIPFWLWLNQEEVYLLLIGNNEKKSWLLLSDLQAEFEGNPAIISDFGEQKTIGSWEDGYFITNSGFIGQALGMGQSPRGLRYKNRRPNLCVADDLDDKDLIKNPKRIDEMVVWIEQDLMPTMDGPVARLLVPNNRAYPKTIQSSLQEKHPDWHLDEVAAYDQDKLPTWSEKYPKDYYVVIENELGSLAAQAEYNNRPWIKGKIFNVKQIQWAPLPRLNLFKHIVGHWDVAYSGANDYNAVKIWGVYERNFYCIKAFVRQCRMKEAVQWMVEMDQSMPISAKIQWQYESQFWNETVIQTIDEVEIAKGHTLNLVHVDCTKVKKYDRILTMQPLYQNGRIYYNEKEKGSNDMLEGLNQLYGIEPGYHTKDDSPDADEQAIRKLLFWAMAVELEPSVTVFERPYQSL